MPPLFADPFTLRDLGCEVNEYIESDLIIRNFEETAIFNMVRNWTSIHKLQQMEDEGYTVINSGYGIENCTREKMTRLLMSNNISHPASLILPTDEDPTAALEEAGFYTSWIKRGDFHAIHREDVTYVRNPEEAKTILKEYAIRGIKTAVINEHLVGDLVKFYGVTGTDFFYWFYPSNQHHSKFGLEQINGTAKGIPFDEPKLLQLCQSGCGSTEYTYLWWRLHHIRRRFDPVDRFQRLAKLCPLQRRSCSPDSPPHL